MMTAKEGWHLTAVVTACLCVGLYANGLDSAAGQSIACILASFSLCLAIVDIRPAFDFWRIVRWPLLLFAAALGWLLIVQAVRLTSLSSASDLPLAPDLFLAKFLSIVAGVWALLTGALLGWRASRYNDATGWILFFLCAHLLLGLALGFLPSEGIWSAWTIREHGRFKGLIGNANVTAAMCAVGAILSFASIMALWNNGDRDELLGGRKLFLGLFVVALLLNLAVLALTASRFPAAVALLAMILLVFTQRRAAMAGRSRRFWPPVAIAVAAIAISQLFFSDLLFDRIGNLEAEAYSRSLYWGHFFDMAFSAPWTGYGPGTFSVANVYFLQGPAATTGLGTVNSPHNIFLQLWFVGGVPYLLLMMAGASLICWDVVRHVDLRQGDMRHIGLFLAGTSLIACAMVDIVMDYPVGTQVAFFLIGLAWTGGHKDRILMIGRA